MSSSVQPVAEAETIRKTTYEILQNPEYQLTSLEGFAHIRDKLISVLERIAEWLEPVGRFFDALYNNSPVVYYLVLAGLFLLLFGLMYHILWSFRAAARKRARAALYATVEIDELKHPGIWETRAKEALDSGNYLFAIRFILTASLIRLEIARKGRFRKAATNREYLIRYRHSPVFAPLSELVEITDSRWYGTVPATREDVESCFQAYDKIQAVFPGYTGNESGRA